MSTTPAPRTLFQRWIDDAAVFPPGLAPVPRAWSEHVELLAGPTADLLGPLLVGASAVDELLRACTEQPPPEHLGRVGVTVVGRAGTSVQDMVEAVAILRDSPHLEVVGAEIPHAEGDRRALVDLGLRTAIEVPRAGAELVSALDDLASAQPGEGDDHGTVRRPLAKLRTQATADAPAPDARQVAEFLMATHVRGLAFKLTGGLHRAVAPGPSADEPHGALNIVIATHHLLRGSTLPELVATLEVTDRTALAALTASLGEQDAQEVRARFVSFGCCGVQDPLDDLTDLGLITDPPTPTKESS